MTTTATAMMNTYPAAIELDRRLLAECVDACVDCAEACTACADACLGEHMISDLAKCIRGNLDCADICDVTGRVLSRHTGYDARLTRAILLACVEACRACGDECAKHADAHEHCRLCAEACRRCEDACMKVLASMAS